jgi:phosphoesterase RecJ-like protein
MKDFATEFNTLNYVIKKANKILLVAHSSPDGDTAGSVLALDEYFSLLGKQCDIACFDPFPSFLENLTDRRFIFPDHLNIGEYDAIIGCDSVERGFDKIIANAKPDTVTVIIDHHPDIKLEADVKIINAKSSSTCELIYQYFQFHNIAINRPIATYLMIGILGDTGNFQHANTTSDVMRIASELMKKGASSSKIVEATFTNKKLSTLRLWGIAFGKAKINSKNGMIMTVLTQADLEQCNATSEDIGQVSSILNTVPGTKFALVLSEREGGIIKGSLRSEEYKGTDVSEIAHMFGGGGHKLASGFQVKGKIKETEDGWEIV